MGDHLVGRDLEGSAAKINLDETVDAERQDVAETGFEHRTASPEAQDDAPLVLPDDAETAGEHNQCATARHDRRDDSRLHAPLHR
jgi:hypothetical protein